MKNIMLKCDCNAETLVFSKWEFNPIETDYEISIEDSYCGNNKMNRFKRAWYAFWGKPIVYTSICKNTKEGKEELKQWLKDCLDELEK